MMHYGILKSIYNHVYIFKYLERYFIHLVCPIDRIIIRRLLHHRPKVASLLLGPAPSGKAEMKPRETAAAAEIKPLKLTDAT